VYFSKRNAVIAQPLRAEVVKARKKETMKFKFSALFLPESDIVSWVKANIRKSGRE